MEAPGMLLLRMRRLLVSAGDRQTSDVAAAGLIHHQWILCPRPGLIRCGDYCFKAMGDGDRS